MTTHQKQGLRRSRRNRVFAGVCGGLAVMVARTVAFLIGYLFDDAPLPLFEIVSRNGNRMAYATPATGPRERDARRPVFVLTASRTFSAGEGFAFLLQERRRAEVIGERTASARCSR